MGGSKYNQEYLKKEEVVEEIVEVVESNESEEKPITTLGKDGKAIAQCAGALLDDNIKKAIIDVLTITDFRIINGLVTSYIYWASEEGDAFKMIEDFGYGFPYTASKLASTTKLNVEIPEELRDQNDAVNRLKNLGVFKRTLVPNPNGNYKVTYYILNPFKLLSLIKHIIYIAHNEPIDEEGINARAETVAKMARDEAEQVIYHAKNSRINYLVDQGFNRDDTVPRSSHLFMKESGKVIVKTAKNDSV